MQKCKFLNPSNRDPGGGGGNHAIDRQAKAVLSEADFSIALILMKGIVILLKGWAWLFVGDVVFRYADCPVLLYLIAEISASTLEPVPLPMSHFR